MIRNSDVWTTTKGKEIASAYPLEEEAYFPHLVILAIKMVSSPYKTIDEEKVQKVRVREVKNIQHQLNYTNKVLSTISKAVERIENPDLSIKAKNPEIPQADPNQPIFQPNSFDIGKLKDDPSDILIEINKHLSSISINKVAPSVDKDKVPTGKVENIRGINMIKKDSFQQAPTSKILLEAQWVDMKNHYSQPSSPNLGWNDLHHERHSYNGTSLVTWNINGYSEAQMMNTFQEMLLATSPYSARKTTLTTGQIIISCFTGNLRSWWHN
ncbi:movement protein [Cucumis melo var. makuwa]|uniref:Movement protein n=1 Tax=Cucumis melo var. makuwa TaxID=1194695 RepID=A0A5D3CX84_CUCMM|nr:movement protein [Cucumis melo var. makuwa]TYK14819.1 movement protein [Cucumis melo var. makuwa]